MPQAVQFPIALHQRCNVSRKHALTVRQIVGNRDRPGMASCTMPLRRSNPAFCFTKKSRNPFLLNESRRSRQLIAFRAPHARRVDALQHQLQIRRRHLQPRRPGRREAKRPFFEGCSRWPTAADDNEVIASRHRSITIAASHGMVGAAVTVRRFGTPAGGVEAVMNQPWSRPTGWSGGYCRPFSQCN